MKTLKKCFTTIAVVVVLYGAPLSGQATAATLEWTRQLGTTRYDYSQSLSADGLGNVYISGFTNGDLDGTNAGSYDAFVAKIVPEPSSLILALFGLVSLVCGFRRPRHVV